MKNIRRLKETTSEKNHTALPEHKQYDCNSSCCKLHVRHATKQHVATMHDKLHVSSRFQIVFPKRVSRLCAQIVCTDRGSTLGCRLAGLAPAPSSLKRHMLPLPTDVVPPLASVWRCWLLLAPVGSSWVLVVAAGSCWLPLAAAGRRGS